MNQGKYVFVSEKNKNEVESNTKKILEIRANYLHTTLSDLYNPNIMPKDLLKAHDDLDRAVDKCYGKQTYNTEMERLKLLFVLYQNSTAGLFPALSKKKAKSYRKF